jgi:hypothetical protein
MDVFVYTYRCTYINMCICFISADRVQIEGDQGLPSNVFICINLCTYICVCILLYESMDV